MTKNIDANDLAREGGSEAVRKAFDAAKDESSPGGERLNGSGEHADASSTHDDRQGDYPPPLSAAALANGTFPVPCFVWEGFIWKGMLNLLAGDGGTGKTLFAEHLGVAVAAGAHKFGRVTERMPVLFVLAEDDYGETKTRLEEICRADDISLASLPIHVWCLPAHDLTIARICDDGSWEPGPFLAPLRKMLEEIGPCLLVLDSVSDIAQLDETKRAPVNTLCKQVLAGLCQEFGTTILLIAHPSKAAMTDGTAYAGSTAWNNGPRCRLTLERDKNGGAGRILKLAKANYGAPAEMQLFLHGRTFLTSIEAGLSEERKRYMVLAAALKMIDKGMNIVRANGSGQKPEDVAAAVREEFGVRLDKREALALMNALEREGCLHYEPSDKNTHKPAGFRRGPKRPR